MIRLLRLGYAAFLCAIAVLFGMQLKQGQWLETDLHALLPQESRWNDLLFIADRLQEERLNRQIVTLIGHADPQAAFQIAEKINGHWITSGLFLRINSKIQPDLTRLREEIRLLKSAVLPESVRQELLENPKVYFQTYAEQLVNSFAQNNLLPLEQDWLGFGRFVLPQSQQLSNMQWNPQNGFVSVESEGKTWVLLIAQLKNGEMLDVNNKLLPLMTRSRQIAEQFRASMISAGTSLFSATAKQQAEKESRWMSLAGVGMTLLLLLTIFRSLRVLWLFLPIGLGMLAGASITVTLLGQIHILTLVVGTSLIGVLIDFPLHWLTSSLFKQPWQPVKSMREHQPTFLITLAVTLSGYGLLWFTDLPILKQTALFSAAALITSVLCTILFLPYLFSAVTQPNWVKKINVEPFFAKPTKSLPRGYFVLLAIVIAGGIYRSQWQDDIRQWVALPADMLREVQKIGELTGIDLGSQYFLVTAGNENDLIEKTRELSRRLSMQSQPHQALSRWLLSEEEQKRLNLQIIEKIRPLDYAALSQIGLPESTLRGAINALATQEPVSLMQALKTTLGQGWRNFYLGEILPNRFAGIVKITDAHNAGDLRTLANGKDIFWQDKRAHLNQAFQQSRNQAAWLKAFSLVLAGIFLWWYFGAKRAWTILTVPCLAVVITLGVLGWAGLPVTLFSMFGLLLVSAISIDYVAYMQSLKENLATKRIAVWSAALTTMISFGLLAFSSTPAIASFGLSVTSGVCISAWLACRNGDI